MKKLCLILILALLLSGCTGWMDGHYVYVTPHREPDQADEAQIVAVENFTGLRSALLELIAQGRELGTFSVEELDTDTLTNRMDAIVQHAMAVDPLGAYTVEDISYELGASGTVPAIAVTVTYNENAAQLRTMRYVADMPSAETAIFDALDRVEDRVVVRVDEYEALDFRSLVQRYADANPDKVMQLPAVTAGTYPQNGQQRVLELRFFYQTDREELRSMQQRVQDIFSSARLYVSGEGEDEEKFSQLYSFLAERFEYTVASSVTPAYSLLSDGIGDSRAFAVVYAAMCQRSGLECLVVEGSRDGQSHYWNIICDNGSYRHVDLLDERGFRERLDGDMAGYSWDSTAYPACRSTYIPPEQTPAQPAQPAPTEPSAPTDPTEESQ